MKLLLLSRDQVNDALWNDRVANSGDGLPYAFTEYLDLVNNSSWSAIVTDDYRSIFPLPYESKFGLSMYLQPPFTQQLGLISSEYSLELEEKFISAIPARAAYVLLKGNENNRLYNNAQYKITRRSNYLLKLDKGYETIRKSYSKSLRKRIKKARLKYRIESSNDAKSIVQYYQKEMAHIVGLNSDQYITAEKLIRHLLDSNMGFIYKAINGAEVEGMLFVIMYKNRIINLFGTSNRFGKDNHAMHFILDHIIDDHSESNKMLDFEGSDVPGVKNFYQSFGPEYVTYPQYQIDRLPLWYTSLSWLKNKLLNK